jgi:hypothetical protein
MAAMLRPARRCAVRTFPISSSYLAPEFPPDWLI